MAYAFCGAKKHRSTETCRRPAGWGTYHPGFGRCKLHGGGTPLRHGLRSKLRQAGTLRDLLDATDRKLVKISTDALDDLIAFIAEEQHETALSFIDTDRKEAASAAMLASFDRAFDRLRERGS